VQYDTSNTLVPVSQIANCTEKYKTVGMQSLINIIRGTGATNIIQVPGAQYANSMTHFLDSAYRVSDTLATPQLMGVVDVYPNGNVCGSVTCYSSEYAPVISQMPFMAGEFGQSVSGRDCTTTGVDALMAWFDQQGAGYSAWDWDTWGQCLQLITDYTTGAPNGTWGNDYKNHLASLGGTGGSGQTPDFSLSAAPSSQTVGRAGGSATYTISVAEKNGFQGQVTLSASGQPALSMASFSPNPTTSSSTLTVSVPARAHHGTFTITITGTSSTLSHTATTSLTVSNH
jgi:hypothetical protein